MMKTARDTSDLVLDDLVRIMELKFEVKVDYLGYYLGSVGAYSADTIFDYLGISKEKFQLEILGYSAPGTFPHCRTLFELTTLVRALQWKFEAKG